MEIEELVKLALVNHDIDEEKIMNNVLKKGRRQVAVKRVIISIGISVLLAIPILALSFGLAKGDTTLPPETPGTSYAAGAEMSVIYSTPSEKVTELFIDNGKIVIGSEVDCTKEKTDYISKILRNAFEKYDSNTKFLIKASCVNLVNDSFLYEGKTVDEWKGELNRAKEKYNDIIHGYKDSSAEEAKSEMEIAYKRYENAVLSENEYYINIAKGYLAEKNVKIISSDLNERTVLFISSKESVLEMASEDKEKEIEIEFYLGSQDDAIANTVYTVCE